MKSLSILLAAVAFLAFDCPAADLYRVSFGPENEREFDRISLAYRTVLTLRGQFADLLLTDGEAAELRREGHRLEFVQADPEDLMRQVALDPKRGEYTSYAEMTAELRELASRRPDLVRMRDFGDSWEKGAGIADRDLWAVGIYSKEAEERGAPGALFLAGVHSRELATTEVLLGLIRFLVERHDRDPRIRTLLATRRIWVVPVLNPDGREFVLAEDPWWRKNRRRFETDGAIGVDLNRNFPFFWSSGIGSSDSPASAVYKGPSPLSEPESQALTRLAADIAPAVSLSFHAYGEYILMPYGYPTRQPDDQAIFERVGRELSERTGYAAGTVGDLLGYNSSGRHDDWLYGMRGIISLELELGRTFFPQGKELRELDRLTRNVCLYMARFAGGWPRARVEADHRRRPPDGRKPAADPGRSLAALVTVKNEGLADLHAVRWELRSSGQPFEAEPSRGRIELLSGSKRGSPAVELPVRLSLPAKPTAPEGLTMRLVLEGDGLQETIPLELPVGPLPGE